MTIVTGITDQPNQQLDLRLADGTRAKLTLNYRVQQLGWFADLIWTKRDGTTAQVFGLRLVTSPNVLRQFRNLFPFGLAIATDANADPTSDKSFASGISRLLLLEGDDVEQIETEVYPGL